MNLPEVKKALHVDINPNKWKECNHDIHRIYQRAYDSTHLYPKLFEAGLRILIFSGNTDAVISH